VVKCGAVSVWCSVRVVQCQCGAVCYSICELHRVAVSGKRCSRSLHARTQVCCSAFAVCCSAGVLQCGAVCCRVGLLQSDAVSEERNSHSRMPNLKCAADCCSVLQCHCVAVRLVFCGVVLLLCVAV